MKFRLIPVTVFILCIALVDRTFDVLGISWVQHSRAAEHKEEPKKEEAKKDAKEGEKKADKKDDAKKEGDKAEGDKKEGDDKEEEAKKPAEKPAFSTVKPVENIPQYTKGEKEILEKLSERRAELDKWQADLEVREKLIDASSQKLDAKIVELKQIQTDTATLLKTYNEHEDAKIRSLVKIYEAMKPKDAANIFNEMDMDITLEIIDKMAEKKASPVLAAMDPKRARKITEELALQRSLKEAQGKRNMDVSRLDSQANAAPATAGK